MKPTLAVFDFDGTLTARDTSLAFLAFAAGRGRLAASLAKGVPDFVADFAAAYREGTGALRSRWEVAVHDRLLAALFTGTSAPALRDLGRRFAAERLDAWVTKAGLEQVAWHKAQGHRCVLVTASLDRYAEPWGWRAGFHDVIASRISHDIKGVILGGFHDLPCWGDAKLARLREVVGPIERWRTVVYGNEPSDRPLLERADHPVRVTRAGSWKRLSADVRERLRAA